jgi:hypothetical protein
MTMTPAVVAAAANGRADGTGSFGSFRRRRRATADPAWPTKPTLLPEWWPAELRADFNPRTAAPSRSPPPPANWIDTPDGLLPEPHRDLLIALLERLLADAEAPSRKVADAAALLQAFDRNRLASWRLPPDPALPAIEEEVALFRAAWESAAAEGRLDPADAWWGPDGDGTRDRSAAAMGDGPVPEPTRARPPEGWFSGPEAAEPMKRERPESAGDSIMSLGSDEGVTTAPTLQPSGEHVRSEAEGDARAAACPAMSASARPSGPASARPTEADSTPSARTDSARPGGPESTRPAERHEHVPERPPCRDEARPPARLPMASSLPPSAGYGTGFSPRIWKRVARPRHGP